MLSVPAFNSLLKTLEEPPPRSLFIFCTTNPEKIPFTVVSRCQRYDLRRIATAEVAAKLAEIAEAESVKISRASLLAVARAGDGSMRDAQTLLDQLISFGGAEVDDARVAEVLDLTDRRVLLGIAAACIEGDVARALETARRAWDTGVDSRRLGGELLGTLRDLVVTALAPAQKLVEGADSELEELRKLAAATEPLRLRRMFRAMLGEQENLTWAPDPFAVIEMALVRLATMPASDEVATLLTRIDQLERRLRDGGGGASGGGGARVRSASARAAGGDDGGGGARARNAPSRAADGDGGGMKRGATRAQESASAREAPAASAHENSAPENSARENGAHENLAPTVTTADDVTAGANNDAPFASPAEFLAALRALAEA